MPIYQITPLYDNHSAIRQVVEGRIEAVDRHELPSDCGWVVRFKGTSVELSQHLSITGQQPGEKSPVGSALVVAIGAYYGRGPSDLWEWLKTRIEGEA